MKDSEQKINKIIINENNDNYTKELDKLLEMGFEKEKAYEAIKYAKGNMELAIEYLYNGISNKNNNQNSSMEVNVGDEDDEENGEDFEDTTFLLKKLASVIKILSKEKEKKKDEILEIIQKYNFSLFQFIKENEDEFNLYFFSPITSDDYKNYEEFKEGKEKFGIYNFQYRIFDYDNNYNSINIIDKKISDSLGNDIIDKEDDIDNENIKSNITDKDKSIINRLKELGNFNEAEVIQAYFACDKNEEMTANYLFEHINNNINFE